MPGASFAKEELSEKIEEQLSEVRISSLGSISREEEKKEEKRLKAENAPKDAESCLEEDKEVLDPKKVKSASCCLLAWSLLLYNF